MEKTKIDWCDSTWNPVTGCQHNCEYCYARSIAERFAGCDSDSTYGAYHQATWRRVNPDDPKENALFEVDAKCPPINVRFDPEKQQQKTSVAPYPWGFKPTFRRDRLADYEKKAGRTIFVCSMADLFGEWVPDSWIEEVFAACKSASQHNYLFLTKNPRRYIELEIKKEMPYGDNFWFGTSVTKLSDKYAWFEAGKVGFHWFLSVEPLLEDLGAMNPDSAKPEWVIIGAETGKRKDKVVPERARIENLVGECRKYDIPVFMKSSLEEIWGGPLIQEFPKQLKTC